MNDRQTATIQQIEQHRHDHPAGIVIVRGATATGKTSFSLQVAEQLSVEIISADSRQVYQQMDIGTDKVDQETRARIPHHLIDLVPPDQTYTAGQWKSDVYQLIPQIQERQHLPLIVGGTGLYIDMIYKNFAMPDVPPQHERREQMMHREEDTPGFLHAQLVHVDPDEAAKHHPNSTRFLLRALEIYQFTGQTKTELSQQRPVDRPILMIGLRRERDDTNRRINARVKEMIDHGLIDEVQGLLDQGYAPDLPSMQGIGYKEIVGYLQREYDLDRAIELLKRHTHHLGKKQRSRFRRYLTDAKTAPKDGVTYELIELSSQ